MSAPTAFGVLCSAALLCLAASLAAAQPGAPAAAPEPRFRVQVEPRSGTVGDRIAVVFELDLAPGASVVPPALDRTLGEFTVLEPLEPLPAGTASPSAGGAPLPYRARMVVGLYKTGTFELPPLVFRLKRPGAADLEVRTPAVPIEARSVLDAQPKLKELKEQAEIYEPRPWRLWLGLAAGLVVLAGLAWWLHRRFRLRPAPPVRVADFDPFTAVEIELRDLVARGLLDKGLVKPFYVALADIARKAIAAGFGVATAEKTTGEILEEVRAAGSAGGDDLARIEALLTACDLVKFARYLPPRAESEAAAAAAGALIARCRVLRRPPPPLAEAS